MPIRVFPTRAELKSRVRWLSRATRWLLVSMAVLAVGAALVWVWIFTFTIVPLYVDRSVRDVLADEQFRICFAYASRIKSEILKSLIPQADFLIRLSSKADSTELGAANLTPALNLPLVKDAFIINFKTGAVITLNNLVPLGLRDSLKGKDVRTLKAAYTYLMSSGTVNFKTVGDSVNPQLLVMREFKPYYPQKAEGVVGLLLDYRPLLRAIPSKMDSLFKMDSYWQWFEKWWADAAEEGLFVNDAEEKYLLQAKPACGLLFQGDTLWWIGDRQRPVTNYDYEKSGWEHTGVVSAIEGTGLKIPVRMRMSLFAADLRKGSIVIQTFAKTLTIAGLAIILGLALLLYLIRRQSRRNRIALAHLAHSVKTPVARLKLVTDTLTTERVASPEEERALISAVGREVGRLERAVQNAALSLQKGRRTYNIVPGDLTETVREVADSWQPSFNHAGIRLDVDVDADAEKRRLTVNFDAAMMAVALDNILDNALRHTRLNFLKPGLQANRGTQTITTLGGRTFSPPAFPPPPHQSINTDATPPSQARVRLSLQHIDNKAVILVDDMGGGIPKSERRKIFKRFGRVSRDAATGATGLGLGLALVKEIVEGHKGSVRVEDSRLGGARFVIELRVA